MKKFFLATLFLAVGLLTTKASGVDAMSKNSQSTTTAYFAAKPESAFQITKEDMGYWKVRNSWGILVITAPNGQTFEPISVNDGSTFSTQGWAQGTYTAKITHDDVEETTTFTVS